MTSAERSGAEARLLKILRQHEGWVAEMKELRHAIADDGTSQQFVPVSHEGPLVQDAKVAGLRAGEFVVRTWMQIKALTSEVPTAFQPSARRSSSTNEGGGTFGSGGGTELRP